MKFSMNSDGVLKKILPLGFLFLSSGCAIGLGKSLHEYSLAEAPIETRGLKAREIEASADDNVILGFTFDTDFADKAYRKLLAECPRGRIVNMAARYSTDLGILAYKEKLKINGTCLE